MTIFGYGENAWGRYYQNYEVNKIEIDSLNKSNTLSLYLYGALERPKDDNRFTVTVY